MKEYSGENPQFVEGVTFKLLLPLGKNASNKRSDQVTDQVTDQVKAQNSEQVKQKILTFCLSPKSKTEIMEHTGYKHRTHFSDNILSPIIKSGQLSLTIPEKPNSRLQKYITK